MNEYKVVDSRHKKLETKLNKLAKEGWNVVTMARSRSGYGEFCVILVREIPQKQTEADKIARKYVRK